MRVRWLIAAAVLALPASSFVSGARAEILITVSKAEQRVAVNVDGAERYRWPVSTGRRGYDTPAGQFRPVRLEPNWHSRKYDWAPMPNSIFFYKGYAMHGTVEERNLGRAASHGCVRLSRSNAATLFALLRERGKSSARIVVTNASLRPEAPSPFMVEDAKPASRPQVAAKAERHDLRTDEARNEPKSAAKPVRLATTGPVSLPADLHGKAPHDRKPAAAERRPRSREAGGEALTSQVFTSTGDDAAVLRGREAWLRSLDRKYGIAR
ncbi:MAG: L,D-transpeptidase family protein [Pseudolabrys sp.]|jgi:hypothetical protein